MNCVFDVATVGQARWSGTLWQIKTSMMDSRVLVSIQSFVGLADRVELSVRSIRRLPRLTLVCHLKL